MLQRYSTSAMFGGAEERFSVAPNGPDPSLDCLVAVGRYFLVRFVRIRRPPVWALETALSTHSFDA